MGGSNKIFKDIHYTNDSPENTRSKPSSSKNDLTQKVSGNAHPHFVPGSPMDQLKQAWNKEVKSWNHTEQTSEFTHQKSENRKDFSIITDKDGTKVIDLGTDYVAMFGYGSLLSRSSMEKTLGEIKYACVPCALAGWRRSFNIIMPNRSFYELSAEETKFVPKHIIYLNIRRSHQDTVNGLLYILPRKELLKFDEREWIYNRSPISPDTLKDVTLKNGEAYVYTAKPEWCLDPKKATREQAAVRASYLRIIEDGLEELGPEFRKHYDASTDPVPKALLFTDQRDPNLSKIPLGGLEPGAAPIKVVDQHRRMVRSKL